MKGYLNKMLWEIVFFSMIQDEKPCYQIEIHFDLKKLQKPMAFFVITMLILHEYFKVEEISPWYCSYCQRIVTAVHL